MKTVIEKAIQKAQNKGLSVQDTADLVIEYLDIAGELTASPASQEPQRLSQIILPGTPTPATLEKAALTGVQAPAQVNKVIARAQDSDSFWTAEALYAEAMKHDWSFQALPDGFKEPLNYVGAPVLRPRGIDGVAIIFNCPDVKIPREIPAFVSLSEKVFSPDVIKEGVKTNVESMFRQRETPIVSSTVELTSYPSDLSSIGVNGGTV